MNRSLYWCWDQTSETNCLGHSIALSQPHLGKWLSTVLFRRTISEYYTKIPRDAENIRDQTEFVSALIQLLQSCAFWPQLKYVWLWQWWLLLIVDWLCLEANYFPYTLSSPSELGRDWVRSELEALTGVSGLGISSKHSLLHIHQHPTVPRLSHKVNAHPFYGQVKQIEQTSLLSSYQPHPAHPPPHWDDFNTSKRNTSINSYLLFAEVTCTYMYICSLGYWCVSGFTYSGLFSDMVNITSLKDNQRYILKFPVLILRLHPHLSLQASFCHQ